MRGSCRTRRLIMLAWKLEKFLWTLNILGSALVVWRLYSNGLHSIYRFFCASLVLSVVRSVALYSFSPRSATYYWIWTASQPFYWLFYVLVVFELYSLVLKRYRGIYSVGRWLFFAGIATALIASALTIFPTVAAAPDKHPHLYYYALIERGVVTSLAVCLLLLLAVVAWFPVPLSRNLLTHCSVYSSFFFVNNVIVLYWHASGANARLVAYLTSVSRLSIGLVCLLCWIFLLSRRGEERQASLLLGRSPLQEKRLLGQLETLNATLLRTAQK